MAAISADCVKQEESHLSENTGHQFFLHGPPLAQTLCPRVGASPGAEGVAENDDVRLVKGHLLGKYIAAPS